jgi:hypothetical protein
VQDEPSMADSASSRNRGISVSRPKTGFTLCVEFNVNILLQI